jgi:membrane protein
MGAVKATAKRVRDQVQALTLREAVTKVKEGYAQHDVLTYASALAYQLFYATIPMFALGLGLAGGVGLEEAWSEEMSPQVEENVSAPAFQVIDSTVEQILGERQLFWITAGAIFAVWALSGGVRALMEVLDRIYECDGSRPFARRFAVSIALTVAVGALLMLTALVVIVGPRLLDGPAAVAAQILRFPLAAALLFGVVWLIVRYAPADRQPLRVVTFGSLLVVVAWLGTSAAFAWYLQSIADYGSVFGALATLVITLNYLYIAAIAFLTGALLDAILRE